MTSKTIITELSNERKNRIQKIMKYHYGFEPENEGCIVWKHDEILKDAIDNRTFLFGVWDQNYMRQFIGFDITISCCFRHDGFFDCCHYDLCCAYINEVKE